ncbi:insulin-like growth factor-binding protein complex acid labile subunit [Branchiostoma floridae]|uniref:Insulin-like growth factor-binding protein complex acid labile subunit n=1 Tax=Branchiostoma floridae TaxID=7739 RepID=A0A9J7KH61_BRAFL|nr:insulin-like growth factor-binding protein complex acid labile subunit [Branchiostoma floridae]
MYRMLIFLSLMSSLPVGHLTTHTCPIKCCCPNIRTAQCGTYLTVVPTGFPETLESLDLTGNRIAGLDNLSPQQLPELTEMNLGHNYLTLIPANSLSNFTALQVLKLKNNRLDSLTVQSFNGLSNLVTLVLHENRLTSLPAGMLTSLTSLSVLSVSKNELSTFRGALTSSGTESGLKTFILDHNKFSSLSSNMFQGLANVETLMLDHNEISDIASGAFSGLSNLANLSLSYNSIAELQNSPFRDLEKLKHLYLQNNDMTYIDSDVLRDVPNIETLYLQYNKLSSVPPLQGKITNLNIAHNNLQGWPQLALPSLQTLLLYANSIHNISKNDMRTLINLETLELQFTGLQYVEEDAFDQQVNLKRLILRNCALKSLPPRVFSSLTSLEELHLQNNRLVEILDDTLYGLSSLKELYVFGNAIGSISDLSHLSRLTILNLARNKLTQIPDSIRRLNKLELLNFDSNQITNVSPDVFYNLTSLQKVYMYDNPYHCDCALSDFVAWAAGKDVFIGELLCASPVLMRNRTLKSLSIDQLELVCNSGSNTPAIVGGIFGGIAIGFVASIAIKVMRRKSAKFRTKFVEMDSVKDEDAVSIVNDNHSDVAFQD